MSSNDPQLAWTEDQWNTVHRAVQETARKARVASSFLPLVGPLPASTTTVPAMQMSNAEITERLRGEAQERLAVDESEVLRLTTISSEVYLKNSEATDPDLASAIAMFCRAADVIARVEDALVFNGFPEAGRVPTHAGKPVVLPSIYAVHGGTPNDGLLGRAAPPRIISWLTSQGTESLATVSYVPSWMPSKSSRRRVTTGPSRACSATRSSSTRTRRAEARSCYRATGSRHS